MKRISLIIIALFSLTIWGCNTSETDQNGNGNHPPDENHDMANNRKLEGNDQAQSAGELNLNNGKKWIVNRETHYGMLRMDSVLRVFEEDPRQDFKMLGESLNEQTDYIIKKCSMTGTSHDMLHLILIPILKQINAIKSADNAEEGNKNLKTFRSYLKQYFNYFELKKK